MTDKIHWTERVGIYLKKKAADKSSVARLLYWAFLFFTISYFKWKEKGRLQKIADLEHENYVLKETATYEDVKKRIEANLTKVAEYKKEVELLQSKIKDIQSEREKDIEEIDKIDSWDDIDDPRR